MVFGGDANLCNAVMPSIASMFGSEHLEWQRVEASCRELAIDALVVKDTDEVWADQRSWVWTQEPVVANRHARAFLCAK